MNYLHLLGLVSRRLVRSSTDSTDRAAFWVPEVFYEEIREDRRSRDSARLAEGGDANDEGTVALELPEDWDDEATAAAFANGAALLRGEVGIDTLTEVNANAEPITEQPRLREVRVAPVRPAKRGQSHVFGLVGRALQCSQERWAFPLAAVVLVSGAVFVAAQRSGMEPPVVNAATKDPAPSVAQLPSRIEPSPSRVEAKDLPAPPVVAERPDAATGRSSKKPDAAISGDVPDAVPLEAPALGSTVAFRSLENQVLRSHRPPPSGVADEPIAVPHASKLASASQNEPPLTEWTLSTVAAANPLIARVDEEMICLSSGALCAEPESVDVSVTRYALASSMWLNIASARARESQSVLYAGYGVVRDAHAFEWELPNDSSLMAYTLAGPVKSNNLLMAGLSVNYGVVPSEEVRRLMFRFASTFGQFDSARSVAYELLRKDYASYAELPSLKLAWRATDMSAACTVSLNSAAPGRLQACSRLQLRPKVEGVGLDIRSQEHRAAWLGDMPFGGGLFAAGAVAKQ